MDLVDAHSLISPAKQIPAIRAVLKVSLQYENAEIFCLDVHEPRPKLISRTRKITDRHTMLSASPFFGVITTPIGCFRVGSPAIYAFERSLYSKSTRAGTENMIFRCQWQYSTACSLHPEWQKRAPVGPHAIHSSNAV